MLAGSRHCVIVPLPIGTFMLRPCIGHVHGVADDVLRAHRHLHAEAVGRDEVDLGGHRLRAAVGHGGVVALGGDELVERGLHLVLRPGKRAGAGQQQERDVATRGAMFITGSPAGLHGIDAPMPRLASEYGRSRWLAGQSRSHLQPQVRRMDRYERILSLHRILKSARYPVTVARLQDELDCSRATVYRDLAFLRDALMAPVVGDGEAGFRYQAEEGGRFELPGLWLNSDELHALLAAQQLLSRSGGGVLSAALAPLQSRIEKLLDEHAGGKRWPVERVRVIPHRTRRMRRARVPHRVLGGAGAQAAQLRIPRALDRREDPAHGVAAARHPLPRQLVPRRLGPRSRGAAQFLRRPHHRRAHARCDGARHRRARTRPPPRRQLRHLLRPAEGHGDDRLQPQGRALGGRRALAFAAAGPLPRRRPLRTQGAVQRRRANC